MLKDEPTHNTKDNRKLHTQSAADPLNSNNTIKLTAKSQTPHNPHPCQIKPDNHTNKSSPHNTANTTMQTHHTTNRVPVNQNKK